MQEFPKSLPVQGGIPIEWLFLELEPFPKFIFKPPNGRIWERKIIPSQKNAIYKFFVILEKILKKRFTNSFRDLFEKIRERFEKSPKKPKIILFRHFFPESFSSVSFFISPFPRRSLLRRMPKDNSIISCVTNALTMLSLKLPDFLS